MALLPMAFLLLSSATVPATGKDDYGVERFLQESPPLVKIVYGEDPSTYGASGQSSSFTNYVYHQAAWQPPSFYVQNLTNSRDIRAYSAFYLRAAGCTRQNMPWVVDQAGVDEKGPLQVIWLTSLSNSIPEQSLAKKAADDAILRLQRARGLWMHLLRPGSLQWADTNRFKADADVPVAVAAPHDSNCTLSGRIAARDGKGRPTRIEYNCAGFPKLGDMSLEFFYEEPVGDTGLPNIIVSTTTFFAPPTVKHSRVSTNLLKYVEMGTDATLGPEGYIPAMFVVSNRQPDIVVSSNGVEYRVDGTIYTPLQNPPPYKPERFALGRGNVRRILVVCCIAISFAVLLIFARKGPRLK